MLAEDPHATARMARVPLHAVLATVPSACLFGTLVSDIVYWRTAAMMWADISAWLLTVGLIIAIPLVVTGLIDFFGDRRVRALGAAWLHGVGTGLALLLSILNAFIHSRDAYTSVVPEGLTLSAIVVVILLVTIWPGRTLVYRHRVGVQPRNAP
jgi:uncharacterized membrane protein